MGRKEADASDRSQGAISTSNATTSCRQLAGLVLGRFFRDGSSLAVFFFPSPAFSQTTACMGYEFIVQADDVDEAEHALAAHGSEHLLKILE